MTECLCTLRICSGFEASNDDVINLHELKIFFDCVETSKSLLHYHGILLGKKPQLPLYQGSIPALDSVSVLWSGNPFCDCHSLPTALFVFWHHYR
jgi:hypothetical protein